MLQSGFMLCYIGNVFDTEDLNMLPKNRMPDDPPGMDPIIIHRSATTCKTAHTIVHGVLCKCSAQYNVAMSVSMYKEVVSARSLLNMDFKWFHGPYRKLKLIIKNMLPNVNSSANFLAWSSSMGM